jgi:hypothetical protein
MAEVGEVVGAANLKSMMPASATLLGMQTLYTPDICCEVEATVVFG